MPIDKLENTKKLEEYILRFDAARDHAALYKNRFQQIYDMFMPNRDVYDTKTTSVGELTNLKTYDTTGVLAVRTLVSQLHVGMTPIGQRWLDLEPGSLVSKNDEEVVKKAAQKVTEIIFKYLEMSNFHLAINEAYYDLIVGTAALVCNIGDIENPFIWSAVPLPEYFPEKGPYGTIETIFRMFLECPYRDILRYWPKAKIPQSWQQKAKENPNLKVEIREGTIYEPKTKQYHYVVFSKDERKFLYEETAPSSPWIVFRGYVRQNEVFGCGPAFDALPTMQTCNVVYEDELRAGAFRGAPIYLGINDGTFNPWTVVLEPNTIIPVSPGASPNAPPLFPVPQGGNPEYVQVQLADLREMINKFMFTQPLGPIEDPAKTATEIMIRHQMALEEKVPFIGRVEVEGLGKMTQRMVYILRTLGLFPNVQVDGKELTVKYKSPLIQSQKLADATKIVQYIQTMQSLLGPELSLAGIDIPKLFEELAEKMEIPLEVIKDNIAIQEAVQRLEEMQAQQAQGAQLPSPPVGGLPQGGA